MLEYKVCSKCNKEKPTTLEYFHKKGEGLCSQCKVCVKERDRRYYKANPEKYKDSKREWQKANLKKRKEIQKRYREKNPSSQITRNLRKRIWCALKGKSKSDSTLELLGCSVEEFILHLETQFTDGMSWDNYGLKSWHIDHIKPCAAFDLLDPEAQRRCFHYSNLQPLWAEDNLAKGAKLL